MTENTLRTIAITLAETAVVANLAILATVLVHNKIQKSKRKKSQGDRSKNGSHQNPWSQAKQSKEY